MATISNTPRPGYIWDATDNVWYPIGVGAHQHTNAADTPAVMPYSTYAAAGKNKVINGDFGVWQRGTSFSTADAYTADRWVGNSDATFTLSRQTFTPGTAPVSGYEGQYFARFAKSAGGNYGTGSYQKIEDVRTFAGQTVTLSFWAKADAAITLSPYYNQVFGSGGSGTVGAAIGSGTTLTTSWSRYSLTFALPSISGKTVGTNSFVEIYVTRYIGSAATTIDLWGVQLEAGSTATAFQTATGTLQGELAACQRYYQVVGGAGSQPIVQSYTAASAFNQTPQNFPVQMRVAPTATKYGTWTVGNTGQPSAANVTVFGYSLQTQKDGNLGTFYFYPDSADDIITFSAEL